MLNALQVKNTFLHFAKAEKGLEPCTSRWPVAGNRVVIASKDECAHDGSGSGWILRAGEQAEVVKVDADGDFVLRNPDGMISTFVFRRNFAYVQGSEASLDDESIMLVNWEEPLKRHVSEPAPSYTFSGTALNFSSERRGDCQETCSTVATSEGHDDELSQSDSCQRQTSDFSEIDGTMDCQDSSQHSDEGFCRQVTQQIWPAWTVSNYQPSRNEDGQASRNEDGQACNQVTSQMWSVWASSNDLVPQVAWVPTAVMVPTFQPASYFEVNQFGTDTTDDSEAYKQKEEAKPRPLAVKATRRKETSLITLAQKAQNYQHHQHAPTLSQLELRELRKQLDQRRVEVTAGSLFNEAGEVALHLQNVAFCPFCGAQVKPSDFRICGQCGEDISKVLAK
jgi:hypothetical protein